MKKKLSTTLINKVRNYIIEENFDIISKNILLAFSGGQDSICLLLILLQLQNQFNNQISLIYFNHMWTSSNLYQLIHLIKISFCLNKIFLFSAANNKYFNENDGRIWRYGNMQRIGDFYSYKLLLSSHTLTDRVETLLLNLFRGSSIEGLIALRSNQFIKNKYTKQIFLSEIELNV